MILQGLKPRIFKRFNKFRARWVAGLPSVLWSLRTTPSRSTGFTPFFMVHGSEAVLPIGIEYGSPRVRAYTEEGNQVALEDTIDQLDEARDVALLRSAKYQQALRHYHERNMRLREFHFGDLILRRVQSNKDRHKLSPPWEGLEMAMGTRNPSTRRVLPDKETGMELYFYPLVHKWATSCTHRVSGCRCTYYPYLHTRW
jgi:hypothetical protein